MPQCVIKIKLMFISFNELQTKIGQQTIVVMYSSNIAKRYTFKTFIR